MILRNYKYKNVNSTNDLGIKMIKKGYLNGIITTEKQKKGRGQHGKKWISKKEIYL